MLSLPIPRDVLPPGLPEASILQGWHVLFKSCLQNAQDYGSDAEHMNSVIYFDITRGHDLKGEHVQSLYCTIRQPYGGNFDFNTAPLTVLTPIVLQGQISQSSFELAVGDYYRSLVGSQGAVISIDATGITMKNNKLNRETFAIVQAISTPANPAW